MCSNRGDAHFDSILDEMLITKTINNFKEATDALGQKLKTIHMSAEGVISKLTESNDHFKCLKSDVLDNIQCLEELLKKEEEKPSHNLMGACVPIEWSNIDDIECGPLLEVEFEFLLEQRYLIAKKKRISAYLCIPDVCKKYQKCNVGLVSANKHVITLEDISTTEEFVFMSASEAMDKLAMSPQMKAILLSFKKLHFKPSASQDVEGLKSLDEEEQDLNFPPTKGSCQTLSSCRSKVYFSRTSENQNKNYQLNKVCSSMGSEKGENIREAFSVQSSGAVRQRRRSWVVSKHILARSNTVDSLQLQKSGDFCCSPGIGSREGHEVCGKGAQANSTPQSPSMATVVDQYTFEKRIKPKSASVVSNKPLSPALNPRKSKTGRVSIKPSSALVMNRGKATTKTNSLWEKLSDERKFLINKWLDPQDR
ncbi:hypothetical protein ACROYT_G006334 [Oculina patagonica]